MPKHKLLSSFEAVVIIESAWIRFRNRQLFQILKMSIRTLENFMSLDILRRTSPKDFDLLRDLSIPFTLRFRFSGPEFPPIIVFKIYTDTHAVPSQYVSPGIMNGKKQVTDKTKFISDLVKVRGPHSVSSQLLKDEVMYTQYGILSPEECVTSKDCFRLKSIRDELPAYMGGKGNTWRKLTLSDVPRMTILHDVLGYALGSKYNMKMNKKLNSQDHLPIPDSRRIRALLPHLVANNDMSIHFQVLTTIRRETEPPTVSNAQMALIKADSSSASSTSRKKAAKARAKKLLQLYTPGQDDDSILFSQDSDMFVTMPSNLKSNRSSAIHRDVTHATSSYLDDEADELFEWSRNLPSSEEF